MSEIFKDKLFVTRTDFDDFRDFSKNITDEKINIFIRESQIIEIRGFLGEELFLLMQEDFDDLVPEFSEARFTQLWYGTNYVNNQGQSIRFNGYANSLIYFAYGRFLLQQQANVSRFGVQSLQDTVSEDVSQGHIRTKSKEALSMAIKYQQDTSQFLKSHKSEFPEYEENETKPKDTSLTFFKL